MATKNLFYKSYSSFLIEACWEGEKALPKSSKGYTFEVKPIKVETPYGISVDVYEVMVKSDEGFGSSIRVFEKTPRQLKWGTCPKEFLDDLTEIRRTAADRIRQKYRIDGSTPVKGGTMKQSKNTIDSAALASMSDAEKLEYIASLQAKADEEKAARRAALEEKREKLLAQLASIDEELAQL